MSDLTYGVAIAVPAPWGEQLRAHRASFGDPQASMVPTHITVIGPTETDARGLAEVCTGLAEVTQSLASFDVTLQGTGTFRPISPVVFITLRRGIAPLERLEVAVRTQLGVELPRYPFHPHVTVAHELEELALDRAFEELADFNCEFAVTEIGLYLHDKSIGWTPRHSFPLT